jgi:hypothetical protein
MALLVLMIRWSNSGSPEDSVPYNATVRKERAERNQALLNFLKESTTGSPTEADPANLDQTDPLIDEIVTGEYERQLLAEKERETRSKSGSFTDIRKSLGLD